jgi:hypothetical protein
MYGFLLDTGPSSTGGPGRRRGLGWRPGGDLDRRMFMPSMSASLIGTMRLSISFGNISTLIHNHHPRWVTIRWRLQHPVRRKLRDCRWSGSLNDCSQHSGPEDRIRYRKFRLRSSGSGRLTRAGGSDRRGQRITEARRSAIIAMAHSEPPGRLARDGAGKLPVADERAPAQ